MLTSHFLFRYIIIKNVLKYVTTLLWVLPTVFIITTITAAQEAHTTSWEICLNDSFPLALLFVSCITFLSWLLDAQKNNLLFIIRIQGYSIATIYNFYIVAVVLTTNSLVCVYEFCSSFY